MNKEAPTLYDMNNLSKHSKSVKEKVSVSKVIYNYMLIKYYLLYLIVIEILDTNNLHSGVLFKINLIL